MNEIINYVLRYRVMMKIAAIRRAKKEEKQILGLKTSMIAANKNENFLPDWIPLQNVFDCTRYASFLSRFIVREDAATDVIDTVSEKLMSLVHKNTALTVAESKLKKAASGMKGETADAFFQSNIDVKIDCVLRSQCDSI
eukprot:PhF_6_TR15949/c0_g3_i2/m.24815